MRVFSSLHLRRIKEASRRHYRRRHIDTGVHQGTVGQLGPRTVLGLSAIEVASISNFSIECGQTTVSEQHLY